MNTTTICTIGNSEGVRIPRRILRNYSLNARDEVIVRETPNGILISKKESLTDALARLDALHPESEAPSSREDLLRMIGEEMTHRDTKEVPTW